jgi:hypothetical protein
LNIGTRVKRLPQEKRQPLFLLAEVPACTAIRDLFPLRFYRRIDSTRILIFFIEPQKRINPKKALADKN